jgi:hypothetical protein
MDWNGCPFLLVLWRWFWVTSVFNLFIYYFQLRLNHLTSSFPAILSLSITNQLPSRFNSYSHQTWTCIKSSPREPLLRPSLLELSNQKRKQGKLTIIEAAAKHFL